MVGFNFCSNTIIGPPASQFVVVIIWWLDLQFPVQCNQSVVSSNPTHGEVYSIQHYMIRLVSDL
jgi:hypothetical protein